MGPDAGEHRVARLPTVALAIRGRRGDAIGERCLRANALGFATQLIQGTGASVREAIDVADAFAEWLAVA